MLGWLSGAKIRVGFDRSHAREIAPWLVNVRIKREHRHMVDTYRQLLQPWRRDIDGAARGTSTWPVYDEEDARVQHDLELLQLKSLGHASMSVPVGRPSSGLRRDLPKLVKRSTDQRGLKSVVVWSGETERSAAEQIVHALGPAGVLAPTTTLRELAQWLRRAEIVVSSDTVQRIWLWLSAHHRSYCLDQPGAMNAAPTALATELFKAS